MGYGIPEPTIKEAYERIVLHFSLPEAKFGYNAETFECLYRAPDGTKCAVGCLVPDHAYLPWWDDNGSKTLEEVLESLGWEDEELRDFLRDAQITHDEEATGDDPSTSIFLRELEAVFRKHTGTQHG